MKKNNYLIIDFGNGYIKAGLFSKSENRFVEIVSLPKTEDAKQLLDKLSCLQNGTKIDLVVESITCRPEIPTKFNNSLKSLLKDIEIKIITRQDFNELLDLSNIAPEVIVGTDILLLGFYGVEHYKKGVIFSLGSVYFGVVFDNRKLINVLLTPSIVRVLGTTVAFGAIDQSLLPQKFDKTVGLNTHDAFSAGANLLMEGYVDNVVKQYNFAPSNILLTGGDTLKFINLSKKYKYEQYLVLIALADFIKAKSW